MFYTKRLTNGLRIIAEPLTHFRSCSVGIWVNAGSVKETTEENGISHCIEHMLFKGTKKRTARQIAVDMDAIGGQLNAFTGKECTCYYVRVMDEHIENAFDLLSDILFESSFDPQELAKEKEVILEEISMVEDVPEDLVHELLAKSYFGDDPLGKTILGPADNIKRFEREDIFRYMDKQYDPSDIVLAVAGNFQENKLYELADKYFGKQIESKHHDQAEMAHKGVKRILFHEKATEQDHVCLAMPAFSMDSDDAYALHILNNIFGGSMSSRLFQKIREEKGLAYSVFSYPSSYKNTGYYTVYYGAKPSKAATAAEILMKEIEDIKKNGVTEAEFEQGREQLKGNYMLGQESVGNRMTSLGKSMLLLGKVYNQEDMLAKIEAVTMDDIHRIIPMIFDTNIMAAAIVGKTNNDLFHIF
ncbi:MAG: M16 family metallopeptidase [Christensenellales bacterium]